MNDIFWGLLIGFGSGIVVFPIGLWIINLIRNTMERRRVKKMVNRGDFLVPIDPKDYNTKAWQGQKYGNINPEDYKKDLERLNDKIFKKKIEEEIKQEPKRDFMVKIHKYIDKMKEKGYSDEYIIQEFQKRNYSESLIRRVFEEYGGR